MSTIVRSILNLFRRLPNVKYTAQRIAKTPDILSSLEPEQCEHEFYIEPGLEVFFPSERTGIVLPVSVRPNFAPMFAAETAY